MESFVSLLKVDTGPARPARNRFEKNRPPRRERTQTKLESDNRKSAATTLRCLRSLAKM